MITKFQAMMREYNPRWNAVQMRQWATKVSTFLVSKTSEELVEMYHEPVPTPPQLRMSIRLGWVTSKAGEMMGAGASEDTSKGFKDVVAVDGTRLSEEEHKTFGSDEGTRRLGQLR